MRMTMKPLTGWVFCFCYVQTVNSWHFSTTGAPRVILYRIELIDGFLDYD